MYTQPFASPSRGNGEQVCLIALWTAKLRLDARLHVVTACAQLGTHERSLLKYLRRYFTDGNGSPMHGNPMHCVFAIRALRSSYAISGRVSYTNIGGTSISLRALQVA